MELLLERVFHNIEPANEAGTHLSAHLLTLQTLARVQSPLGPIVECGVRLGFSTTALLAGAVEGGGHLTSIDVNPGCRAWALRTMGIQENDHRLQRWRFMAGSSFECARHWQDRSIALFFLDTSHTLQDTRRELAAWAPKLRDDGILCGHDYCLDGVKQAVQEFVKDHPRYRLQVLPFSEELFVLWPSAASAKCLAGTPAAASQGRQQKRGANATRLRTRRCSTPSSFAASALRCIAWRESQDNIQR